MATTGHHKGVALLGGLQLTGLPAWLLWRAYYLSRLPTLGRKLRIWVEWTWSLFFPLDITHLRFTRTQEVDALGTSNGIGIGIHNDTHSDASIAVPARPPVPVSSPAHFQR